MYSADTLNAILGSLGFPAGVQDAPGKATQAKGTASNGYAINPDTNPSGYGHYIRNWYMVWASGQRYKVVRGSFKHGNSSFQLKALKNKGFTEVINVDGFKLEIVWDSGFLEITSPDLEPAEFSDHSVVIYKDKRYASVDECRRQFESTEESLYHPDIYAGVLPEPVLGVLNERWRMVVLGDTSWVEED